MRGVHKGKENVRALPFLHTEGGLLPSSGGQDAEWWERTRSILWPKGESSQPLFSPVISWESSECQECSEHQGNCSEHYSPADLGLVF